MVEKLLNIFIYSPKEPLIFTRFYFWAFFAVVMAGFSILYKEKRPRNAYLLLMSLFFYYKSSGVYVLLLIFSIVVDFFIGKGIYITKGKFSRLILIILSVLINLLVLSYFKYGYFFVNTVNSIFDTHFKVMNYFHVFVNATGHFHMDIDKIVLPVGISFFTFQSMSYIIDIYRKKLQPLNSILDYAFFVSFFPQLVAGPIVRASEFIPQIHKDYKISKSDFGLAVFMIMNGLLKKLFISDFIAINLIDRVFSNPAAYTGVENLLALYGYSMQVYADFSGYTDIAIGVALLMGFRLATNFNSPYKAVNVGEFWKRWHISLSSWLKDYLYIPLGGNRSASVFTYFSVIFLFVILVMANGWNSIYFVFICLTLLLFIVWLATKIKIFRILTISTLFVFLFFLFNNNWIAFAFVTLIIIIWIRNIYKPGSVLSVVTNTNLFLTMLIGGFWHGASWQFVIWGGLNGIGLLVYKQWKKISPFNGDNNWLVRFYSIFLTFNFITLTRIWFRGESLQKIDAMMGQIINAFHINQLPEIASAYKNCIILLIFAFVIHWLPQSFKQRYKTTFANLPSWAMGFAVILVVIFIYQFQTFKLQTFIYFAF